jgi:hypothetical protein
MTSHEFTWLEVGGIWSTLKKKKKTKSNSKSFFYFFGRVVSSMLGHEEPWMHMA